MIKTNSSDCMKCIKEIVHQIMKKPNTGHQLHASTVDDNWYKYRREDAIFDLDAFSFKRDISIAKCTQNMNSFLSEMYCFTSEDIYWIIKWALLNGITKLGTARLLLNVTLNVFGKKN